MLFSRNMAFFYFCSTLKSLGVILGGGLNIKVQLTLWPPKQDKASKCKYISYLFLIHLFTHKIVILHYD